MRTVLVIAVVSVALASQASAQGGGISLFSDPSGTDCHLHDSAPGLCSVYIVHVNSAGVTASEFGIGAPACLQATFLSYTPLFAVDIAFNAAAPLLGRSVGYGVCLATPIHVATISYFCQALTPPCCLQWIGLHAGSGKASTVDCASNLLDAWCGTGIWNPDASCSCLVSQGPAGTLGSFCNPVAIHPTTWGRVKEMFGE